MYNYSVESNKLIAQSILSLRLKAKSLNDIFAFVPGQYACLSFIHDGRHSPVRCFSIAGSPHQRGILEFGIKIEGNYTDSLTKLKRGDLIEVMGPFGNFLDDTIRANEIVFFAGGIGLTPFLSAIRLAAQLNWPQKITLLYSVRTFNDAAFINELADLQNSSPNFNLHLFLSKEDASIYNSKRIASGQITGEAIDQILANSYSGKKFFVCGPGQFMTAMRKNLLARKVDPADILTEEFSAADNKESNSGMINKSLTKYISAGVVIAFVLAALTDAAQYNSRLNAATTQNATTPPATVTNADSSSAANNSSTTNNSNTQVAPSVTNNSTNNFNQYTPPKTSVS